ncbi:MAG: phosphoribosyltransferase [Candidatus Altiarchaeota archaeon]|nr:phosphoribosyltransferase [Candidatus Altiarchaeota archaeon]
MKEFSCDLRSWDNMRALSEKVAGKIIELGYRPDVIVGILRGGLVPAMNLSDLLGIYNILTVRVRHWGVTATKDGRAVLDVPLNQDLSGKKILLVDDLTDTGESFMVSLEHIKTLNPADVKTAALIHKSSSSMKPDFYAEEAKEWKWIILPWNLTEDLCNLVRKVMGEQKVKDVSGIRTALKQSFDLAVSDEGIEKILEELRRRGLY